MNEAALLLTDGDLSPDCRNITKVLSFFGVAWRALTAREFLASFRAGHKGGSKARLFCSPEDLSRLIADLERSLDGAQLWRERVHSVFVFAGNDSGCLHKLLGTLYGDNSVVLNKMDHYVGDFVISDQERAFCGAMAGVRVAASNTGFPSMVALRNCNGNANNIISTDHGATFLRLKYQAAPVFLSTSREIIDLDAELTAGVFDIRDGVLSALPVVLYVKWAFAETCWNAPEVNACLVIDDPLLKPTYGFVDFHDLKSLMRRHRFSTNIAFIPWNSRRSAPDIVGLFRENPEQFSLSVHGCDHTRAEFGSPDRKCIYWKAEQAVARMAHHESKTGIHHDRVMVFPQGVFSEVAMSVLKQTEFIGVVNNDAISVDPQAHPIKISELWDVAVMSYDNFPIFTRRYPWAGVENFAFDILLGKPCIISIHHDFCSDQCERLVRFVERLNALKCPLRWRGLGEVVRRGLRQREVLPGVVEVEIYGTEARVENDSMQAKRFVIQRRECSPSTIREIQAGPRTIAWDISGPHIRFEFEVGSHECVTARVHFHNVGGDERCDEDVWYKAKTMLRRCLSEARDNYILKYRLPYVSRFARIN